MGRRARAWADPTGRPGRIFCRRGLCPRSGPIRQGSGPNRARSDRSPAGAGSYNGPDRSTLALHRTLIVDLSAPMASARTPPLGELPREQERDSSPNPLPPDLAAPGREMPVADPPVEERVSGHGLTPP